MTTCSNCGNEVSDSPTSKATPTVEGPRILELERTVRLLLGAIDRYVENPGCNIPARTIALQRLRWASEEGSKVI